jgi:hypothetical protein
MERMSFAEKMSRLSNLDMLDHESPLYGLKRELQSGQAGERRRGFKLSLITDPTTGFPSPV